MTAWRSRRIIPDATGCTRTKYSGRARPGRRVVEELRDDAARLHAHRLGARRARLLEVEEERVGAG